MGLNETQAYAAGVMKDTPDGLDDKGPGRLALEKAKQALRDHRAAEKPLVDAINEAAREAVLEECPFRKGDEIAFRDSCFGRWRRFRAITDPVPRRSFEIIWGILAIELRVDGSEMKQERKREICQYDHMRGNAKFWRAQKRGVEGMEF